MRAHSLVLVLLLGLAASPTLASTAYVTDSITVAVFSNANLEGEPLERIVSGALVDVLQTGTGVTQVKVGSGKTGWLRTTFLTTNLPISIRLEEAESQVSKLNGQLDKAKSNALLLEKEAAKAKDLVWMRAELKKARDKVKSLETKLAVQKKQLTEFQTQIPPVDPVTEARLELENIQALNADLEQRLAATLLINSDVDLMADIHSPADEASWTVGLSWGLAGLGLGLLAGFAAGYRWLARQVERRYVKVY